VTTERGPTDQHPLPSPSNCYAFPSSRQTMLFTTNVGRGNCLGWWTYARVGWVCKGNTIVGWGEGGSQAQSFTLHALPSFHGDRMKSTFGQRHLNNKTKRGLSCSWQNRPQYQNISQQCWSVSPSCNSLLCGTPSSSADQATVQMLFTTRESAYLKYDCSAGQEIPLM
jgi:hypothetical protein